MFFSIGHLTYELEKNTIVKTNKFKNVFYSLFILLVCTLGVIVLNKYFIESTLLEKIISATIKLLISTAFVVFLFIISNIIINKFPRVVDNKLVRIIDQNSFKIYLFHSALMYPILYFYPNTNIHPVLYTLTLFIIMIIGSLLISLLTNAISKTVVSYRK